MAAAQPFPAMPFALGVIKPTANTPLQINSNFTDLGSFATASLYIQALATNTQPVYILGQTTATAKDLTGYTNVIFVLTAGQNCSINGKYGNSVALKCIWVDPTVSGEGVFATLQEL
jgi:hypothetical protein